MHTKHGLPKKWSETIQKALDAAKKDFEAGVPEVYISGDGVWPDMIWSRVSD